MFGKLLVTLAVAETALLAASAFATMPECATARKETIDYAMITIDRRGKKALQDRNLEDIRAVADCFESAQLLRRHAEAGWKEADDIKRIVQIAKFCSGVLTQEGIEAVSTTVDLWSTKAERFLSKFFGSESLAA